eukprot:gnl/Trimastix_PCT/4011.p2 GENE.gnl/Trimastix_PCT/4011~~gnl/Trimastix_PCT/4011.p2  ORF type:complete len:313 (+),score=92.84 gnl/Trimastix_PCT/4011:60-998(+)
MESSTPEAHDTAPKTAQDQGDRDSMTHQLDTLKRFCMAAQAELMWRESRNQESEEAIADIPQAFHDGARKWLAELLGKDSIDDNESALRARVHQLEADLAHANERAAEAERALGEAQAAHRADAEELDRASSKAQLAQERMGRVMRESTEEIVALKHALEEETERCTSLEQLHADELSVRDADAAQRSAEVEALEGALRECEARCAELEGDLACHQSAPQRPATAEAEVQTDAKEREGTVVAPAPAAPALDDLRGLLEHARADVLAALEAHRGGLADLKRAHADALTHTQAHEARALQDTQAQAQAQASVQV